MRLIYTVTGLVLLPVALFLGYKAINLSYYTSIGPGPGFFPVWLCGLLAFLAIIMIVQASFGHVEPLSTDFLADGPSYLRVVVALLGLFATAGLLGVLGFRVTTFAFYVVLLVIFGRRNILEIIVLAAIGSFGVYYLFSKILGQPLPTGLLDW